MWIVLASGWALRSLIQLMMTVLACSRSCSFMGLDIFPPSISGQPSVCIGLFCTQTQKCHQWKQFCVPWVSSHSVRILSFESGWFSRKSTLLSNREAHCRTKALQRETGQMSSCFQMCSKTADLCKTGRLVLVMSDKGLHPCALLVPKNKEKGWFVTRDSLWPKPFWFDEWAVTWHTRLRSRASSTTNSWSSFRGWLFSFALLCDSCEGIQKSKDFLVWREKSFHHRKAFRGHYCYFTSALEGSKVEI